MSERRCPRCDELACFCPEGVKEPSIQWSGMFDEPAIAAATRRAKTPKAVECEASQSVIAQKGDA